MMPPGRSEAAAGPAETEAGVADPGGNQTDHWVVG